MHHKARPTYTAMGCISKALIYLNHLKGLEWNPSEEAQVLEIKYSKSTTMGTQGSINVSKK